MIRTLKSAFNKATKAITDSIANVFKDVNPKYVPRIYKQHYSLSRELDSSHETAFWEAARNGTSDAGLIAIGSVLGGGLLGLSALEATGTFNRIINGPLATLSGNTALNIAAGVGLPVATGAAIFLNRCLRGPTPRLSN